MNQLAIDSNAWRRHDSSHGDLRHVGDFFDINLDTQFRGCRFYHLLSGVAALAAGAIDFYDFHWRCSLKKQVEQEAHQQDAAAYNANENGNQAQLQDLT